jgi:hypothetical protein
MSDRATTPAYYAKRGGIASDWWTVLHPPYTAWHLAYVVIGAVLAPRVAVSTLLATLLAFFLAVGVAAHTLDELRGRPLGTALPRHMLIAAAIVGLAGAVALGIVGATRVGWPLVPLLVVGPVLVVGYNLEIWGGRLHNAGTFAAAWGAFPVLTAYVAQTGTLRVAPVLAAAGALVLSLAQRSLSTPARLLRRRVVAVDGALRLSNGENVPLDRSMVLAPLEQALRAMSWAIVLIAAAMAVAFIN